MRLFGNITFFTPLEHINGLLLLFIFPQFDYPHHIFYICSSQYPTSPWRRASQGRPETTNALMQSRSAVQKRRFLWQVGEFANSASSPIIAARIPPTGQEKTLRTMS